MTKMHFKKTDLAKQQEENNPELNFKPVRKTAKAAGYDMFCCLPEDLVIEPHTFAMVGTGVHIDIQSSGFNPGNSDGITLFGGLFPRSSTKGLMVTNHVGVCDEDYQGEYKVSFYNYTDEPITLKSGDRVIQVLFIPAFWYELEEIEIFQTHSERGEGGFGSTGKATLVEA